MRLGIDDWDWEFVIGEMGLGIGIEDWELGLGIADWGSRFGIGLDYLQFTLMQKLKFIVFMIHYVTVFYAS